MAVDSFKYLPRLIATFYQETDRQPELPIPWTPLLRPLAACRFGLVTSAGLYHQGVESPFDVERERKEPEWGDPTFRTIPTDVQQAEIGASHLHINTGGVMADVNILLPIHRFHELVADGAIGGLAERSYSFMGYQGYPPDTAAWKETYGPQVADQLIADQVDCVFLTPA